MASELTARVYAIYREVSPICAAPRRVATPCGPLMLRWAGTVAGDLEQAGKHRRTAYAIARAATHTPDGWSSVRQARYRDAVENAREWCQVARRVRMEAGR